MKNNTTKAVLAGIFLGLAFLALLQMQKIRLIGQIKARLDQYKYVPQMCVASESAKVGSVSAMTKNHYRNNTCYVD